MLILEEKAVAVMADETVWDESMVRHDADLIMSDAWLGVQGRIGGATLLELVALDEMQKWIEFQRSVLVRRARVDDDHSWTEIGYALGVSKQAAAKKYGPWLDPQI
jgi:hypothetical protein